MKVLVEITLVVDVPGLREEELGLFVKGVEFRTPASDLLSSDVSVTRIVPPEGQVCDFCSGPPVFSYPTDSFVIPNSAFFQMSGVGEGSTGDWLACPECSAFIDGNDYGGLSERSLRRFRYDPSYPLLKKELSKLHRLFRRNRTGPRQVLVDQKEKP